MNDVVTMTKKQAIKLAAVLAVSKDSHLTKLVLQAVGGAVATVTVKRADAKKMQSALLLAAQRGLVTKPTYMAINDAFRRAYDETLRRKCGEV